MKRYPPQYKKAATMPLLDVGQRQHGFCSISVMNEVARLVEVPPMRVYGMPPHAPRADEEGRH